jgi:WD40 repeat protein
VLINNPFESCDFRVGAYDGNIYKVNFSNPNFDSGINHDNIFKDNKGIVWRNDVRIFISNMKDSEIKEMKTLIENKCKDRKISNLTMEEFLKLRPNVNKIYVNAIKAIYERHFSPITSINFNYFVKNLLATTSYDGGLRLYYGDENGLKYFYTKICSLKEKKSSDADYYTYTTWSPYKPKILVSGNSVGEIEFDSYEAPTNIYGPDGTNAELTLGMTFFNDSWQGNIGFPITVKQDWGTQSSFGVIASLNHRWD